MGIENGSGSGGGFAAIPRAMVAQARMIHAESGLFGFFRGLQPTLWRDVPFSALFWYGVEEFKPKGQELERKPPGSTPYLAQTFVGSFV